MEVEKIIAHYGSIIGAFAVFDSFIDPRVKGKLSEYIFGFHNVGVKCFEENLICSFIGFFLSSSLKIKLQRVLVVSFFVSPIIVLTFMGDSFADGIRRTISVVFEVNAGDNFLIYLLAIILIAIVSFPADILNMLVSKQIYYKANFVENIWAKAALDALISGLVVSIVLYGLYKSIPLISHFLMLFVDFSSQPSYLSVGYITKNVYSGTLVSMLASVIFLFGVKFLALVTGFCIRSIIMLTKINSYTILYTNAHNFPFTFLALVWCLISILVRIS